MIGTAKESKVEKDPAKSPHDQFVRQIRQNAIEKLQESYNEASREGDFQVQTVQQIARSARAILATNREIWDRCKDYTAEELTREKRNGIFFKRLIYGSDRLISSQSTSSPKNSSDI